MDGNKVEPHVRVFRPISLVLPVLSALALVLGSSDPGMVADG